MPIPLRAAIVALGLGALCACGGSSTSSTAATTTGSARTQQSSGSASSSTTTGGDLSSSSQQTSADSNTTTPTPVADPCALIPKPTLLAEFHTDANASRLNAEKQTVSGGQGCIFDLTGAVDVEVILTIVAASGVDTSGGGVTIAGHPASYRQTEGGAAEFDVTVSATDAFTLSVRIGGGGASTDTEKQPAQDLAGVVAGVYH
jgi:hypothetical protein